MVNTIVFPSSFFDIRKVDEDLQEEYDAVMETGLFDVVIFGYENGLMRESWYWLMCRQKKWGLSIVGG